MIIRAHKCINCHFLIKRFNEGEQELKMLTSKDTRDLLKKNKKVLYDFSCYFGVWDEGCAKIDRDEEINQKDRKNSCFFWPFNPGMLLPAAANLQKRQEEYRAAAYDRRLTIYGLWIAALALVASIIIQLVESK